MTKRLKSLNLDPEAGFYLLSHYAGFSMKVEPDRAYRLTIPKRFRAFLKGDELTLVGVGNLIQIWDRETFTAGLTEARKVLAESAERLVGAVYGFAGRDTTEGEVENADERADGVGA